MLNASLSSTYAPVIAEAKTCRRAAAVRELRLPAERLSAGRPAAVLHHRLTPSNFDSQATLDFIKATAKDPVKIGFSAMAIPLSRGEIDFAEEPVQDSRHDAGGPRRSSRRRRRLHAVRDQAQGCRRRTGSYSWAPWVTQVRTFEALRRLGWKGDYIAWAHLEAEGELARLKDGKFYVIGANALFQDDLPIQKEIDDAAKKAGSKYPRRPDDRRLDRRHGDRGGAQGRRLAGRPPPKCAAAMENLKVDTKGLRGGPIVWTKDNHFRTQLYYRVYQLGRRQDRDACRTGRTTTVK